MADIKHIFFDLDHTLWDFEHNSREVLTEMYNQFKLDGFGIALGNAMSGFIANYERHNALLWTQYRNGKINKHRLRKKRFEEALQCDNIKNKKLAKTLANYYTTACPHKKQLVDGAQTLLEALHTHFNLHIITNGFTEIQATKLQRSGIAHYFKNIVTSELASAAKPNKAIFDYALKLTKAIPEESLMIGDNLQVDILGAKNAGMQTVWYNPKSIASENVKSFSHLLEIKQWVMKQR